MQNAEGLGERKLKILHAINPDLSGDRRTGRIQNNIQIYGFEFKFCDDPK